MPSASLIVARAFWGVCIFRLGPQDLPRSGLLLALAALANLVLGVIINQRQLPLGAAILVALLEFGVLTGLTALLTLAFRYPRRLVQTLTALFGSGAVIGSLALLMLLVLRDIPQILRVGIFLWNLLVMAHILRHALQVHMAAGFVIAIGYAMVLIQLIGLFGRSLGSA
ncbi:MAG: hypothetical protein H6977_20585 [Gammaproteobacteria bacterium]|nr:hypothetical protein [Gammaproteobacteria bacterium]